MSDSQDDKYKRPGFAIADYLRLKYRLPPDEAPALAGLLGLCPERQDSAVELDPGQKKGRPQIATPSAAPASPGELFEDQQPYPDTIPQLPFIRHLGHKSTRPASERPQQGGTEPEPESGDEKPFKRAHIPSLPLQPWAALWPFLKQALSATERSRQIDFKRLIATVTNNRPLRKIPRKVTERWPQELVLIVDHSSHLVPVYHDFFTIIEQLMAWFPQRLTLLLTEQSEQTAFTRIRGGVCTDLDDLPDLPERAAVLVLSDLGLLHQQPWSSYNWQAWGKRLGQRHGSVLALIPAHPEDWHHDVVQHFQCACLDYGRHPQIELSHVRPRLQQQRPGVLALNTLLAPMARITPALLRQARISHPESLTISDEISFWSQPSLGGAPLFKQWLDGDQQRRNIEQLGCDHTLSKLAEQVMLSHENTLPQRLQIEQRQHFSPIKSLGLESCQKHYLQRLTEKYGELDLLERKFLNNWLTTLEDRKGTALWIEQIEPLYHLYFQQLPAEQQQGKVPPVGGLSSMPISKQQMELVIRSRALELRPAQPLSRRGEWQVAALDGGESTHLIAHQGGRGGKRLLKKNHQASEPLLLPDETGWLTLSTEGQTETFDAMPCPSWATGIGRDRYGLFVEVMAKNVPFVMRWIPPGWFMLGSPENEPEKYSDEGPQQLITFEQGYWLAETVCTQALWKAVVRENPSRFKGEQKPVEKISWETIKGFIDALNKLDGAFDFRLPSEAEWEYACRAGTTTPFWFGEELTTDDANYNGNSPYNNGKKGEYREETMPVKFFRRNPWGLYQMHGNVWEWCEDYWHGNYEGAAPNGGARLEGEDKYHVCRGGSWLNLGRYLRSASRSNGPFGYAYHGFRLARGPESSNPAGAEPALRRRSEGRVKQPHGRVGGGKQDEN